MAEGSATAEDDWDAPPRVVTIPELHLDGFDGPMDLLLDLAERQRFDLVRISVLDLSSIQRSSATFSIGLPEPDRL